MKQLLCILSCCVIMTSYAADNPSQNEQALTKKEETTLKRSRSKSPVKPAEQISEHDELEQRLRNWFLQRLADCGPEEFLKTVKQNPFLREKRIKGWPVIRSFLGKFQSRHSQRFYPKEQIEELLKLGVDIDQKGQSGKTTLMSILADSMEDAWGDRHTRYTQGLLDHKADPALQDDQGRTALGYAFEFGAQPQLLVLLQHEKIPSIINQPTCIHSKKQTYVSALINSHSSFDVHRNKIMEALLTAGAKVTAQDIADAQKQPEWRWEKFLQKRSEEKGPE